MYLPVSKLISEILKIKILFVFCREILIMSHIVVSTQSRLDVSCEIVIPYMPL